MKKTINSLSRFCYSRSLGLLLIRVAVGLLFMVHGWQKLQDMSHTVAMFAGMGFPHWVAYFIAGLEFVGGAALILGILTRLFAVAFGIEMLVAACLFGLGRSLGGVELTLSLASFGLALTGSGRYAFWAMECPQCGGMVCTPSSPDCPGATN